MQRSDLKSRAAINSAAHTPATKPLRCARGSASPSSASHEGSCFKENINSNKFETPKLSMEPLQMKKKKKGGCNMRKSLAWDRAFFTEEGVLDPVELSIISGASCKELPVINEGTLGHSQSKNKSSDQREMRSNQSKEFPKEDLGRDRRKHCLSLKSDSSSSNIMISTSSTSRTVSTPVGGNSHSRCGDCPRPLPSSSLKRLANTNAGKPASRGTKLPKVPGSKTGPNPVLTSGSSIPKVNHVDRNQIAQPGLKSLPKSLKNIQSATKASTLPPMHPSDKNSSNISMRRHLSVNISPVLAGEADKDSGSNTNSTNIAPSRLLQSSEGQDEIVNSASSLAHNARDSGRSKLPFLNQTVKGSGLRLPSPSLSFFTQPKVSSLAVGDTHKEICGSQKPGNLKLPDTSRRIFKKDTNIQESTRNGSVAISSRSGNVVTSQVNGASHRLMKSDLKKIPTQVVDLNFGDERCNDEPTENTLANIGTEIVCQDDAEIQRIDNEFSSTDVGHDEMIQGNNLEKAIHSCQLKGELCGRESRNPEPVSEHSYFIHESETKNSMDEPYKERSTSKLAVFDESVITKTHYENVIDLGQESTSAKRELTCKPDIHESCREKNSQLKYSPGETGEHTDKNKILLKTKETESELLGGSQSDRSWCNGTAKLEAPVQPETSTRNSYTGSKHQNGYLVEEAALTEVIVGKPLVEEECVQDALHGSIIDVYQTDILVSDAGGYARQTGSTFDVEEVCHVVEVESQRTSDILLPEKQICLETSEQEKLVEAFPRALNENGGKELSDSRLGSPMAEVGMHRCSTDNMKDTGLPMSREFNSVNDFASSSLSNMMSSPDGRAAGKSQFDASSNETMISDVALNRSWEDKSDTGSQEFKTTLFGSPPNRSSSMCLYGETKEMEIDHCSSLTKESMPKGSWKNHHGNVTDEVLITKACSGVKCTTSDNDRGTDMDNQSSIVDSRTRLFPSTTTNHCCFPESECLELPNAGNLAENPNHSHCGLQFEDPLQRRSIVSNEPSGDDVLGSMVDSFTAQEVCVSNLRKSSDSTRGSSIEHESCSHIDEGDDKSYFQEAIPDASRTQHSPYLNKTEVCEEASSSFNELDSKSDEGQVKAAFPTKNENGDSITVKPKELLIPQHAAPFSDEWLAAIEAAGEDILTMKSGTVQNSPPEKTLPEPSPWSPVKKKNNQIGPFDCTKKTNNLPSDSN